MTSGKYERPSVIQRIRKYIIKDKETECWNFTGASSNDYGIISRKGKIVKVHRYVYWYYKIKPRGTSWKEFSESCSDLEVCHECDNSHCCNPEHLILSTHFYNIQDKVKKDRQSKGENNGNSKLTEKQVLKIYRMKGLQQRIADKFGISKIQVSRIKRGENWCYLTKLNERTKER